MFEISVAMVTATKMVIIMVLVFVIFNATFAVVCTNVKKTPRDQL